MPQHTVPRAQHGSLRGRRTHATIPRAIIQDIYSVPSDRKSHWGHSTSRKQKLSTTAIQFQWISLDATERKGEHHPIHCGIKVSSWLNPCNISQSLHLPFLPSLAPSTHLYFYPHVTCATLPPQSCLQGPDLSASHLLRK